MIRLFVVLAILLSAAREAHAVDAGSGPAKRVVLGTVVDGGGKPLQGVLIFAADARTDAVEAVAASDAEGQVQLLLPLRRHNFGVLSATLGVRQLQVPGTSPPQVPGTSPGAPRFRMVVAPLPPAPEGGGKEEPVASIDAPRGYVVRGRVVDEAGVGLEGVRLEAVRGTGTVSTTAFSGSNGHFSMVFPGGPSRLRASAPGLKALRSAQQGERLVIVMAISAEAQILNLTAGHVLSFRPADSIDPEYTPPAPVRAWLQYTYGICPATAPLKAREKRALKKYWYLDVLRREPPNPATISTVTCSAAASYQPTPAPQTNIGGFEIWDEALPASEVRPPTQ